MTPAERRWLRSMPLSRRHPTRIRVAAAFLGKTMQELATTVGCSRWKIYRIADGDTRVVDIDLLRGIADILEVGLDDLFSDRPDPDRILEELPPLPVGGV